MFLLFQTRGFFSGEPAVTSWEGRPKRLGNLWDQIPIYFKIPIPSMGRTVYLPTWMVDFYGFHVGDFYGKCR